MEVELAEIEPGVARARDSEDAVGVRLVVVAEAARVVDEVDDLVDVRVEEPRVLGIRDHEPRRPLGQRRLDRLGLGIAHVAGVHRDHLVAGGRGARAVAGMGEDRGDDLVPVPLAACLVVGLHHAGVRVDGLRAAGRLEREPAHPRDLAEHALEAVEDLEHPLNRLVVLERMEVGDVRATGRAPR